MRRVVIGKKGRAQGNQKGSGACREIVIKRGDGDKGQKSRGGKRKHIQREKNTPHYGSARTPKKETPKVILT